MCDEPVTRSTCKRSLTVLREHSSDPLSGLERSLRVGERHCVRRIHVSRFGDLTPALRQLGRRLTEEPDVLLNVHGPRMIKEDVGRSIERARC